MKEFLEFIASVLDVDSSLLNEDSKVGSIDEWDSVAHLTLVVEIEGEYGVEIPSDKIGDYDSVKKLYALVKGEE